MATLVAVSGGGGDGQRGEGDSGHSLAQGKAHRGRQRRIGEREGREAKEKERERGATGKERRRRRSPAVEGRRRTEGGVYRWSGQQVREREKGDSEGERMEHSRALGQKTNRRTAVHTRTVARA